MYTLAGKNTNSVGNLRADDIPLLLTEILVQSISANSISGSAPKTGLAFSGKGNFTFNGTPKSLADVTGKFLSLDLTFDGIFSQTETWSDGANVQGINDFTYLMSLLSGNDYFEGSSTHKGGENVQGLGGDDRFKGYGDGDALDYFLVVLERTPLSIAEKPVNIH